MGINDFIMPSFPWRAEEIEICLKGAKTLLSSNSTEDVEQYDLLSECECFVSYLRNQISTKKSRKDVELLSLLNSIVYRLFGKCESNVIVNNNFFDLSLWIPELLLAEIRRNREEICLMIESEKDIQTNCISSPHQPIMTWLLRSKNKNKAEVLTSPSQELVEIKVNRYGIGFEDPCMYIARNCRLSLHENVLICSTFQCRKLGKSNQLILSDYHPYFSANKFRGFSVNEKLVMIHGVDTASNTFNIENFMIDENQHDEKWITLLIIWQGSQSKSYYKISKGSINQKNPTVKEGFFTSNTLAIFESSDVTIGGKHPKIMDKEFHNFNGVISNIEILVSAMDIPSTLSNLIFDNQQIS